MFHMNNNILSGLTLVLLLTAMTVSAESGVTTSYDVDSVIRLRTTTGNPAAGQAKSELCQGCHGENGISIEPNTPNLAGQYSKYTYKQIRDFKSGLRTNPIMNGIAAFVSDSDLGDIAAYFASQTKMRGDGSEGNQLGKRLFLDGDMSRMMVGCINCHGVNGKGMTPNNSVFPVIGGQKKEYVSGQLVNFREGNRSNSPGGVMNIIAQKMTDAEIEALADYVSRL